MDRELVRLALASDRYEVSEAADLAGLRRALVGAAPEVVILDLNLPDGNSLAVLPDLKGRWPRSKLIILTGYGTVEVADEAYKSVPDLFLQTKPIDGGMLRALVELAMSRPPKSECTPDV